MRRSKSKGKGKCKPQRTKNIRKFSNEKIREIVNKVYLTGKKGKNRETPTAIKEVDNENTDSAISSIDEHNDEYSDEREDLRNFMRRSR